MKKFFSGLALLTAVIALASCEEDIFDNGGKKLKFGENEVVVAIKGNSTGMGTRSDAMRTVVAPSNVIDLPREEDEMAVSLVETITSLDDNYADAVMGTRGTPVYTENFDQIYTDGFVGIPFAAKSTSFDFENNYFGAEEPLPFKQASKEVSEGVTVQFYKYCDDTNIRWPENDNLLWFFEAIDGEGVGERTYNGDGSIEFDYTSPEKAEDQKDILFTSKELEEGNQRDLDKNYILFYHVLSGVKFKLSSTTAFEGSKPISLAINSVTINGLKSSGHCTVAPNYEWNVNTSAGNPSNKGGDDDTKSFTCSTWSFDDEDGTMDFSQAFTVTDGKNVTYSEAYAVDEENGYFPESFYADNSAQQNLNDEDFSQTFLFIPQELEEGVNTLTVNYTIYVDGKEQTFEKTIDFPEGTDWKAGELRTYALSISRVLVAIDDVMSEDKKTKSGLTTYNTGTAAEYQRVMVTANWVYTDEEGNDVIVRQYDLDQDEAFTNAVKANGWIKGADGFYYYPNPIAPGCTPNKALFESYTSPAKSYFAETHLVMDICVQAIQCNTSGKGERTSYFDTYWGQPKKADDGTTLISTGIKGNDVEVPTKK